MHWHTWARVNVRGMVVSVRASVEVGVRIVQDDGTRTKKCLQDIRVSVFGCVVDATPEVLVQGS